LIWGFGVEEYEVVACMCPRDYKAGFQYYCGGELRFTGNCLPEAIYVCTKFNNPNYEAMTYGALKQKCAKKCKAVDCSKSNVKDCEQHQLRECE
jgi:hypothetical protein